MKLKDYGRNQKKRKEYIKQSGLLLVGVDVSKAKHDAWARHRGKTQGRPCNYAFRVSYRDSRCLETNCSHL